MAASNDGDSEMFFKVLKTFHESGLHKRNHGKRLSWPSETFCVFSIQGKKKTKIEVIANDSDDHAEIKAIEIIKKYYQYNKGKTMKLLLNYSPCSDCSQKLIEFAKEQKKLKKKREVKLKIYFVQLYKINRPSCKEKGEKCCNNNENGGSNETWLKKLNKYVPIESFSDYNWDYLYRLLKEKYFYQSFEMQLKKCLGYTEVESDSGEIEESDSSDSEESETEENKSEESVSEESESEESDSEEDINKTKQKKAIQDLTKRTSRLAIKRDDLREELFDKLLESLGRFKEDAEITKDLKKILKKKTVVAIDS